MSSDAHRILLSAALGACAMLALAPAHGGEPLTHLLGAQLLHGTGASRSTSTLRIPNLHLDLRAPVSGALEPPAQPPAHGMAHTGDRVAAALSVAEPQRPSSRAEQLVRSFHRDGLPVAKLFQNENSLVHIGLNPKGKPGLWIVEKIH
jgi:hypothetical protein